MPTISILVILLCHFILKFSYATDTITATKSVKDPGTLISDNATFTLGFFSPPNSTHRYIGIWYTKPSVREVIWVANRNNPLNDSSGILKISNDGNLQLLDGHNRILWSSNVSNLAGGYNSTAQLLDSSNLVLLQGGEMIWQSFSHPTDSFLPHMTLTITKNVDLKTVVQSWKSPSDPSDGQFTAGIDTFILPQLVIWQGDRRIWRSGPWNGNIFIGIQYDFVDTINGQLVVINDKQGTISATYFYPNKTLLSTCKLNSEGKITQIWWDDGKERWEPEWVAPLLECDHYGKCGQFGSCNSKRSTICQCLEGFEPRHKTEWSKGNWSGGCRRRMKLQCESANGEVDRFLKIKTVKVPDFAEWRLGLDIHGCRSECLRNCSCLAYAYDTGAGCMTWNTSLVDIQEFSIGGVDLYLRLAHSELGTNNKVKVIIAVVTSLLGMVITALLLCFWWKQRTRRQACKEKDKNMTGDKNRLAKLTEVPLFEFERLAAATNNFSEGNKLGQGGFGTVYRGKLEDEKEIAVKRLSRASRQGLDEFTNEVALISKLQHRNLVKLLGCSIEGEEKILVYEYMPNKSLDTFLFVPMKQKTLDWNKRFIIIEGICRGLQYLHKDSRIRIIHRDLKASNILLDKDLNPKISDFGMARIFGGDQDQVDTRNVVGTYGYMSPEYAMEGKFSEKSDVYSFGVLLMEIISGKRNNDFRDNEQLFSLLGHAWKLWNEKNIISLMDPVIAEPHCEAEILRCAHVALLCLQEIAKDRPSISTVISMLKGEITDLAHPNRPGFAHTSEKRNSSRENRQEISANCVSITEVSGR